MRNIYITDGKDTIQLLADIEFGLGGEEENISTKVASKRIVKDIIGYRDVLEIPVGYLSLENMSTLRNMIRSNNGFLSISYDTPGSERKETFVFDDPKFKAVKYDDNGVAVWTDVTLRARSQEVIDPW